MASIATFVVTYCFPQRRNTCIYLCYSKEISYKITSYLSGVVSRYGPSEYYETVNLCLDLFEVVR